MMVAAVFVHRYYEQVQDHVHPCPITRGWMDGQQQILLKL